MTQVEIESLNKKLKAYKKWFIITVPFALLGCFGVGFIGVSIFNELVLGNRVRLSDDVDTIAEFAQKMPLPEKVEIAERNGCKYFFVVGSSRMILPSGPPVYAFDRQGKLITWISDVAEVGERHPWWNYYDKATRIREVSIQEAIEVSAKVTNE